jgi:DNA-binding MarR family transcriptional regulator
MSSRVQKKDEGGPLLGGLLRLAHQSVLAEVMRGLEAAGCGDLHPPHFAITQLLWDRPDGERLTELARGARITKQSAQALVDQLEASGYVERVDDPQDKRARLVRFTKKGWTFARSARALVRRVEQDWSRRLGPARLEALRETLRELVAQSDPRVER